jgi:hypothetical protein
VICSVCQCCCSSQAWSRSTRHQFWHSFGSSFRRWGWLVKNVEFLRW